jgi:hypothetical protein
LRTIGFRAQDDVVIDRLRLAVEETGFTRHIDRVRRDQATGPRAYDNRFNRFRSPSRRGYPI